MNKKLAFIGVGNMATATLMGIMNNESGLFSWSDIILFDKFNDKNKQYVELGAYVASDISDAVDRADIVFLCVKPQNFPEVLSEISNTNNCSQKLYVTIAAGISMETISAAVGDAPIIRVMPNTPMLIGKGVIVLCRNGYVTDGDFQLVQNVFASSGSTLVIEESEMNRIISVTGSSPAYVFLMIKAMLQGAVDQGLADNSLTEKQLIDCICDTIIGSAELMKAGSKTPDEQIATVCSKGGTTERAVSELEQYRMCEGIISAMKKCTLRADELGKKD